MKYIIKESQSKLIVESFPMCLKRRLSDEVMLPFINDAERDFPTLCQDFGDEFEYPDNVVKRAVDDFLTPDEDFYESIEEDIDDITDEVTDIVKDWFGDYLFEIYQSTCSEYQED